MTQDVPTHPKYEVAISFLSRDSGIATPLADKLQKSFRVFFYPRSQEAVAGTDGLSSMRDPFRHQSRLNVVLYRDGWGETPWTRVEQTAITERCLDGGWRTLFFVTLDAQSKLPTWLPDTHIRFRFADYGLDEAVGAIKARVQETGGTIRVETLVDKATRLASQKDYERRRQEFRNGTGPHLANNAFAALKVCIRKKIDELGPHLAAGGLGFHVKEDKRGPLILLGVGRPLRICWQGHFVNSLDESHLAVERWHGHPPFTGARFFEEPRLIGKFTYDFDIDEQGNMGWREISPRKSFYDDALLADLILEDAIKGASRSTEYD
jgi:hypothetical protein